MFIIPVIWFYSMFDALHKASGDGALAEEDNLSLLEVIGENSNRWSGSKLLGYGLIIIGALLIFDRIISPMIPYEIRNYMQTGIVALLFIAGGIRILAGGRKEGGAKGEVLEECENGVGTLSLGILMMCMGVVMLTAQFKQVTILDTLLT